MNKHEIIAGILMNENTTFSVVEVCQHCHLSEDVLMEWIANGLFGEQYHTNILTQFDYQMVDRVRTAHRLQHDLEVNLQGVILALELMDEMAKMRDELAILKRARS